MSLARFDSYLRQRLDLAQHLGRLGVVRPRCLPDERLSLLLARLQREAEPVEGSGAEFRLLPLEPAVSAFMAALPGGAGFGLSVAQAECFAILDALFARLSAPDELEPGLLRAVAPLRVLLARLALAGADPFEHAAEPGRGLLEFCTRIGRGWDAHAGRKAEELPRRIRDIAQRLAAAPRLGEPDCSAALAELVDFLAEFNRGVAALEQRLISMERAQSRQQDARLYVAQLVGSTLAGRALPESLLGFLAEVWSKYLHTVFLRDGLDSEPWLAAVREIGALADVVDAEVAEHERRDYASRAFTLLGRVREAVESIHHNLEVAARCFEELESLILAKLEGREHGLAVAAPMAVPDPAEPEAALAAGDGDALRRVRSLRVGDWLWLSEHGQRVRCKVADKDMAHGQLFLVNYSGLKVGKREFGALAAEFAAGEAGLLARLPVFDAALAAIEQGCQARANAAKRELIQVLRAREVERARQLAAELAAEEERQAEARARAEAAARAEAERQARERAYQDSLLEVRALQAGGWIELPDAAGKRVPAKLALIMASTRKLVFVDRRGLRLAELTQEALARHVADNQAAILHAGVAFDQTLATLVQQRREHLQEK